METNTTPIKYTLGFSPCPNDTFIFDAMVNGKIDTEDLEFEPIIEDVELLNQKALNNELAITKLSFHTFLSITDNYILLDSGSALGEKVGPLLISKLKYEEQHYKNLKVAIPGEHTTANFLISCLYPSIKNKTPILFSTIEDEILSNNFDAGIIIHESRFTYRDKGLVRLVDLGDKWFEKTKLPIPLGGIVVNRSLPIEIQQKISRVLRRSIDFAFKNPNDSFDFTSQLAQIQEKEIINKHIDLYVNNFTVSLGKNGQKAIMKMFEIAKEAGIIQAIPSNIFLTTIK